MAGNKKIFDLPLRTGVTADDRLAIVDSGNTTTYSIKVSDLQDGTGVSTLNTLTGSLTLAAGTNMTITDNGTDTITFDASGGGGGAGVTGDTLNDSISSVNSIVGTPNVFSGTTGYVNFGYGNLVENDSVINGYNNTHTRPAAAAIPHIVYGSNNNYQQSATGSEGNVVIGNGNINLNDGIIVGRGCGTGRGVVMGKGASANAINGFGSAAYGRNVSVSGNFGAAFGDGNAVADSSYAFGRLNNFFGHNHGTAFGSFNNIQENGASNDYNNVVGAGNQITGGSGVGQNIMGSSNIISSTGARNGVFNGSTNTISGSVSGATLVGLSNYTGATTDDSVYMPAVILTNYATYNYADDAAASAAGLPLGAVYHNNGDLRVRIV